MQAFSHVIKDQDEKAKSVFKQQVLDSSQCRAREEDLL